MAYSSDIQNHVNTTARIELALEDDTLVYLVTVEGYPESDDLTIWGVRPCNADGTLRQCVVDDMYRVCVRRFWQVWDDTDNEYRDERRDVLEQLKAAIKGDTDECRYERAYHAACESRCGHSL